ncbi:ATP-grasp domain-containing protein [Ureibacillus xyleni]|uniref:ATP-grasp domain-containing protein n=1 Tax=Ureibacillus xyleni TaxID=614648 RepID=A0A285RXJ1_9BACL|nr:ATP-grasp domain-containing protein [Ureibacillus xyleni]SOB99293.1 ATP-grasp domain-containing protein [Ureibacillus xyleni]
MSINILLTGGRAPATYYFARLLNEQGHQLFMAESLPKHLCMRSNLFKKSFLVTAPNENRDEFVQDLINIIQDNNIDLVIPTCEEVFHVAYGYEKISKYCSVLCEPLEKINTFHHKGLFIETLNGRFQEFVHIPHTVVIDTNLNTSDTKTIIENQLSLDNEYVCKPAYSRFGTEIAFMKGKNLVEYISTRNNIWVVQEKISGKQICTYAISDKGKMKCYSAYESNDTVGLGATIYFEPLQNEKLEQFVKHYIEEYEYTGQIAFDFIMKDNGEIYPIECNPRTTSGICMFPLAKYDDTYLVGSETTMVGLAMLQTLFFKNIFKQIGKMIKAKDIIWNTKDHIVFFDQLSSFLYMLKEAKRRKISSYQMSTIDIEWNGDLVE